MNRIKLLGTVLIGGGILVFLLTFGKVAYIANQTISTTVSGTVSGATTTAKVKVVNATTTNNVEWPTKIQIPKLGINAPMQYVGINAKGNMGDPNNFTDVAWYNLGTPPGKVGSAVMAGHQNNGYGLSGVFERLGELQVGDDVYVVTKGGKKLHYRVVEKAIYPYNGGPRERIFNAKDKSHLNLITCAGSWLASARTNDKRQVVYTDLVKD